MPGKNLHLADKFAKDYDSTILQNNWKGPEIIFEIVAELIKEKSGILDLGIGTGAGSILFEKAGHRITGIDGSVKMLEQCAEKNIAEKLIRHDLEKVPLPLPSHAFDAVISNGVFHLINPLEPLIKEAARLLKKSGIFVFTYENTENKTGYIRLSPGIWEMKTETDVLTYKYADEYISEILARSNFTILSNHRFLAYKTSLKTFFFNVATARLKVNRQC